jgi:hypothetical protein
MILHIPLAISHKHFRHYRIQQHSKVSHISFCHGRNRQSLIYAKEGSLGCIMQPFVGRAMYRFSLFFKATSRPHGGISRFSIGEKRRSNTSFMKVDSGIFICSVIRKKFFKTHSSKHCYA